MPQGSSFPNSAPYSKTQGGELSADSALRLKIQIAAVSAGLSIPVTGGGTGGGGGTVTIGSVAAGITTALPVSLRGGTTNQDIRIAGISALTTALPVSIRGGTTNQDVRIAGVSGTVPVSGSVTISNLVATALGGFTVLSKTGAGTVAVVAAQGATTKTEVRGFSLYNEGANARRLELRFGNTNAFWKGGLASGAAFNWNLMGGYQRSANNQKVVAYINGAGTAVVTVFYKKA